MKRVFPLMLSLVMALTLTACGGSGSGTNEEQDSIDAQTQDEAQLEEGASEEKGEANDEALLENIIVTYKVDEMMQEAIVTIENTGSMTFDSSVGVYFQNSTGKSIGDDMIFVESLPAGNSTYARIKLDDIDVTDFDYSFVDYSFTEGADTSNGTLDEAASADLATEFGESFGGGGDPEWATSWYHFVIDISVYSGTTGNYAVVTVSDDIDQESIDRIGNTIFANYSKDFSLTSVSVVNSTGDELFLKAN
mgnify:CR=1 FL=1